MEEIELLKQQLVQERNARLQAEEHLKEKNLQLAQLSEKLNSFNDDFERQREEGDAAIQKVENKYQVLIESLKDIVYKITPEGFFTFVNPVVRDVLGYEPEEILGKHFTELVVHEYREQLVKFYLNMMKERKENTYVEFPAFTKDNQVVWIGQSVHLLKDNNRIVELSAVARNITERKKSSDELRTTQRRLFALITNLQKGVLVEDENRQIILVNQLFCDFFGIAAAPDEMIGTSYLDVLEQMKTSFPESGSFVQQTSKLLDRKETVVEVKLPTIDGRILERDYIPIFLDGAYRGSLWEYADITQRYLTTENIRKSEEKYRRIMDNMALGLLEVDNNQRITRAYDRFCKMIGYTEEELVGKIAADLFVAKGYEDVINTEQAKRENGVGSSYEMKMIKKDGSDLWAIICGSPILDENDKIVGSIGVHYDITERKLLEQELANAKQLAEEASKAEKQFLATRLYSVVGAAGELFAVRTHLYGTVEKDTLLDDFIVSLRVAANGYRVIYEPEAYAIERPSFSIDDEMKRKVRIAAGGFQSIARLDYLWNIFKYGWLSFQYVSHRAMRWAVAPFCLPLIFLCNILLVLMEDPGQWLTFYNLFFAAQILFYLLAILGYWFENRKMRIKLLFVPFYFSFMNYCAIKGYNRYRKGVTSGIWEKAKRAA